ncbi:hypothetical protein [Actinomadura parmotrematis]|uniref:PQQ-binding-like beta-propeller repeat protein n=1 Tax=Actinomadura parmotrematis TaxID=2864039 RepID=A0ABS7FTT5_9ACTN|nr:hypothetical protein [Actinomadura parmotrematis]MBW8483787.1 hypothetical protein [Actinomadura parmotrematis]
MRITVSPRAALARAAVAGGVLAAALSAAPPASAASPYEPLPPRNPYAGPAGTATMHGDTGSSDATPIAGPTSASLTSHRAALASACPTVLAGSDGYPVALCTEIFGQAPTVHLLDPATGDSVAELGLTKGSLLGGVYAYLDNADRLVVVDGTKDLLRVGHRKNAAGAWELYIASRLPLDAALGDDSVVGLSPDWQGRVWFATAGGLVGTADDTAGVVKTLALPAGETVANSISTAPEGTAVTTSHATYLLRADAAGTPSVVWRQPYDRGPGRKPGQLSWGSGSTPTFFGPAKGTDYVTIVDNAAPTVNLLVYATGTGRQICKIPVLKAGGSGSENSPIGAGNAVFIASTYGYPYPKLPDGAGDSVPASADFIGGLSRVNVTASGCTLAWDNTVRSAAVPRLSTADGLLRTVVRKPVIPGTTASSILDTYVYTEIDPATGATVRTKSLGTGFVYDTLQMVGTITPGVVYQGTETGVLRIANG